MVRSFPRGFVLLGLAASSAGCAQIAGIEETSGPPDRVSLTIDRVSIGATVVESPQDLSQETATFLVRDDTAADGLARLPAELTETNVWSASVPGDAPAIMFSLPDHPTPRVRIWDFGVRTQRATFAVYEHPAPAPAPEDATVTVEAALPTPYVAGESFTFFTAGTWTTRNFPGAELPEPDMEVMTLGPLTFPYAATKAEAGRPHEAITPEDAVLVLRYAGGLLTGVLEATPFSQTAADKITGTMAAVAADQTLDVQIQPDTVAARYAPLRPAMGAPAMSWNLVAAPGAETTQTLGPSLRTSVSVAAADPGTVTLAYGNPFQERGWPAVFTWSTSASRTITPAGQALPVTLRAQLYTRVLPEPGQLVELSAGLPELIAIDGVPLSTDGIELPRPTRAVTVDLVATGDNTVYGVELFELVPNADGTALEHQFVISSHALGPSLVLPPEMFEPGKLYTLRASTVSGSYPELASGDLGQRSLPVSVAYHDSGVFTVLP